MNKPSDDALSIWNAGLDSVRARPLVQATCRIDADQLVIGHNHWSRDQFDRVLVVGAGKAATEMAIGLCQVIADWLPVEGWINVPEGTVQEIPGITVHPARPAGVNEPTAAGVIGTEKILNLVADAGSRDLCICLISGGGSALLPAPVQGITLEDKLAVIRLLSARGADIVELNTVRKHLSRVKGGGLLSACRAGSLVTLILSDVLGDPLDAIASGPTVVDTTSGDDALAVLKRFDPDQKLDARIYDALRRSEDAKSLASGIDYTNLVIGNNAVAVDAAGIRAEQLGYNHAMQSAPSCEGLAEEIGRHLARMTVDMLRGSTPAHRINCLITGGEPTVSLCAEEIRGRGGRNQQLVLAAYQHLLASDLRPHEWQQIALTSGGTDGEDGPTDAAGAFLSADVHHRATELKLDVEDYLRRNDAYSFFQRAAGLLMTGPTGTNVCDIRVALVRPG
jgi:glycerate-2-kinase